MILASWSPLGYALGDPLGRLGAFLERLGAILGCLGRLGAFLRRLGSFLEPSWPVLAPSWTLRAACGERNGEVTESVRQKLRGGPPQAGGGAYLFI